MTATTVATRPANTVTNTVAAAFDGTHHAAAALQALRAAGFLPEQISLVAKNVGTPPDAGTTLQDAELGAAGIGVLGGLAGWLLGISALAIPVVGEVVGIGILWGTLASAGIGIAAGGLGGALIGHGVDERHARKYEELVREGRSLVTFHAYNPAQASEAQAIFTRLNGVDISNFSAKR